LTFILLTPFRFQILYLDQIPEFLPQVIQLDAEPPQTQQNFIRSFPRFFFLSFGRHLWTNDDMMKDCSRLTFPVMPDMAPYVFLTEMLSLSIGYLYFSPGNPEND
jgi:hypothetical protein